MGRKDKDDTKGRDKDEDVAVPGASLADLERLSRLMRQQGHGHGLNPAQWEALRYLNRANKLSNSPGALARYLGATKGTVSQTLASLEAKGLVVKQERGDDGRSIALALSDAGRDVLERDGLKALGLDIESLRPKIRKRFDKAVATLLQAEVQRQGEPSFGNCPTCRYFREPSTGQSAHCMKISAALDKVGLQLICVEHVAR